MKRFVQLVSCLAYAEIIRALFRSGWCISFFLSSFVSSTSNRGVISASQGLPVGPQARMRTFLSPVWPSFSWVLTARSVCVMSLLFRVVMLHLHIPCMHQILFILELYSTCSVNISSVNVILCTNGHSMYYIAAACMHYR